MYFKKEREGEQQEERKGDREKQLLQGSRTADFVWEQLEGLTREGLGWALQPPLACSLLLRIDLLTKASPPRFEASP